MKINLVDLRPVGKGSYSVDSMDIGIELEKEPQHIIVETPHDEWHFYYAGVVKDTNDVPIGFGYRSQPQGYLLTVYE
jgi:hypothetical protein